MQKARKLVDHIKRVRKDNMLIVAAYDNHPESPIDMGIGKIVIIGVSSFLSSHKFKHLCRLDLFDVYEKLIEDNEIIIPISIGSSDIFTKIDSDKLICDFSDIYDGFFFMNEKDIINFNIEHHKENSNDVSKLLEFLPTHIEQFSDYVFGHNYVIEHYKLDSYAIGKLESGDFTLEDIHLPYLEMDEDYTVSVTGEKYLIEEMNS